MTKPGKSNARAKGKSLVTGKSPTTPIDINAAVTSMVNDKIKHMFGESSGASQARNKRLNSERDSDDDDFSDSNGPPPPKQPKPTGDATTSSSNATPDYATQVVILEGIDPEVKKHPARLSKAFAKTKPNVELQAGGLRLTASGDVLVKPKNPKDCNSLLKEGAFPAACDLGNSVKARVPKSQQITHQVIIKNVDECVTQEEMEEMLNRQSLPFKLVKRIHSRARDAPTKMIRLILKDENTKKKLLRLGIYLDQMHFTCIHALEDSKSAIKVMQCYKCQAIGDHLSGSCTKEQTCVLCSGPHRKAECTVTKENFKCANCSGTHAAWSQECPWLKQAVNMKKTPTFAQVSSASVSPEVLKKALQEVKESIVTLVAEIVARSICELVIDLMGKNLSKAALPLKVAAIALNTAATANKLKFGPADEPIQAATIKDKVVEKCFPKSSPTESQTSNAGSSLNS